MTTKKFGKVFDLESNSTKADEIAALQELVTQVPIGTYLADLFTPRLAEWAKAHITDDFPPDVMEYLDDETRQNTEYAKTISELQAELEKTKRYWEQDAEKLHVEIDQLTKTGAEQKAIINNLYKEVNQLTEERYDLQETINGQETEIVRLKAKLYDLIMK